MQVKVSRVIGYYFDDPEDDFEFTIEALDKTDNPRCNVILNVKEFNLAEWQALSRAVEAGFNLLKEEA